MKKPVKLGLWLLGFAVLALLGLWLEHERAKTRLAAFKAELARRGERLTFGELAAAATKPGDDGAPDFFRAAERLPQLPDFDAKLFRPYGMKLIAPGRARVAWPTLRLPIEGLRDEVVPDLWPDWIAYLETQRLVLVELRASLEKPAFNFTNYHSISRLPVERGMALRRAGSWLEGAALEALHSGDLPAAWAELRAATQLYHGWSHGHLLITAMIYDSGLRGFVSTTWDALQHPGWTDTQLAEWQKQWQTLPCLAVVLRGIEGERAFFCESFQKMRVTPAELDGTDIRVNPFALGSRDWLEPLAEKPVETLFDVFRASVWPVWTSYTDERLSLERLQAELDGWRTCVTNQSFAAGAAQRTRAEAAGRSVSPWMLVNRSESPFSQTLHLRFARMEVERQMVVTAMALRRYQLRHGQFPASLGELVPRFLAEVPRDFMDGHPLRYKLQPNGQFLLWSVGEDGKDNAGDPNPIGGTTRSGNPFDWRNCLDWVWPTPATREEVESYHHSLRTKK